MLILGVLNSRREKALNCLFHLLSKVSLFIFALGMLWGREAVGRILKSELGMRV